MAEINLTRRAVSLRRYHLNKHLSNPQWTIDGDTAYIRFRDDLICVIDAADVGIASAKRWSFVFNRGLYYAVCKSRPWVFLHNLLLDVPSGMMVDHADGNGLNNRRTNIRPATSAQNQWNKRKQSGTKSRFKGVRPPHGPANRNRRTWSAEITCHGKRYYLGEFKTEIEAAKAYDRKARELFGEFARPNFAEE